MSRFSRSFKLFSIGKVGPKGQVVIPAEARTELNIHPGDNVVVMGLPHKKAVMIVNEKTFEGYMGQMRRHLDFLDKYKKLRKDNSEKFDD